MKLILLLAAAALFSSCVGPAHDAAERIAPTCVGYHLDNYCEPFSREFAARMKAEGFETQRIGYIWSMHGETVGHVGIFWRDTDGWWYRDNLSGPCQVDSFNRYTWEQRLDHALQPLGEPVPYRILKVFKVP